MATKLSEFTLDFDYLSVHGRSEEVVGLIG